MILIWQERPCTALDSLNLSLNNLPGTCSQISATSHTLTLAFNKGPADKPAKTNSESISALSARADTDVILPTFLQTSPQSTLSLFTDWMNEFLAALWCPPTPPVTLGTMIDLSDLAGGVIRQAVLVLCTAQISSMCGCFCLCCSKGTSHDHKQGLHVPDPTGSCLPSR